MSWQLVTYLITKGLNQGRNPKCVFVVRFPGKGLDFVELNFEQKQHKSLNFLW